MKYLIVNAAGLCLLIGVLLSPSFADDASPLQNTPVTVTEAISIPMISATIVRGEIESPNTPHIAAKVSAEVISIKLDEGMPVQSGQLLAELDDEAFRIGEESASADIQRMQVLIDGQKKKLDRNKGLSSKNLISESALDDVITTLKQYQAELVSAMTRLKVARYQLSHARIISPAEGIIQQRTLSIGDYVKPGDPLFQIVSTDKLRARLYFPETLVDSVHLGMQVELTQGNKTVSGKVYRIRPMLEEGNRALHALVDFDSPEGWKPGSSVVARIILEEHQQAVAVPEKALVRRPAGVVVYRVKDQQVKEQVVMTGLRQDQYIEILSGLSPGDVIVLEGAGWLSDGSRITIQEKAK